MARPLSARKIPRGLEERAFKPQGVPMSDLEQLTLTLDGLGLSPDLSKWVIRPELGYVFGPGDDWHMWVWSVGVSLAIPKPPETGEEE